MIAVLAQATVLIVAGVGADPRYKERFAGWAEELCAAARAQPNPPVVRVLAERVPDEPRPCLADGRSTAAGIRAEIDAVADPAGGLFLVLIGHGSATGRGARFHLPGPDVGPEDLGGMLGRFDGAPVTVAHLGSAAAAFLPALAAPGRVLVAASREHESGATRFAGHFVEAFSSSDADAAADRNRDSRISVLEAFEFARAGTEREYRDAGLLQTEHAVLDDDGDGVGGESDGALAARRLPFGDPELAAAGEDLRRMIQERDALAARVDTLRALRDDFEEDEYFAQLEELLLRIAEIGDRIEELQEPPG